MALNTARAVLDEFHARGLPQNFCHVPFASLILEPDGRVGSCRMKGTEFSVGNLNTQTLDEIWNGETIRQWRREFLSGEPIKCKTETRHQRCHSCPQYNTLLPQVEAKEVQTKSPLRLALNLNGKCNLECRMCHIWKEPNGLYETRGWWEQVTPWLKDVKEIDLLSGEPFIQKDTYRLFDDISKINPECLWSVTTNGHWKWTEGIGKSLDQIKFKHLIVSIDSLVPETYSKIRKKGKLEVVLENLKNLLEYDKSRIDRGLGSLNLHLTFLIQKDNWMEAGPIYDFCKERDVQLVYIFLYEPEQYSLLTLSESEREEILTFYFSTLTEAQLKNSRRIFLPILDSLNLPSRANYLLELGESLNAHA